MTHRTIIGALSLAIATLIPFTALAIEFKHPEGPFVPVHNCTCRFEGTEVPLGQRRCIRTAQGPRSAMCVLEQNVTSWRPSADECPQASLHTPRS